MDYIIAYLPLLKIISLLLWTDLVVTIYGNDMIDDSCLADLLSFLNFNIGAERAIKEEVWDITCVSQTMVLHRL